MAWDGRKTIVQSVVAFYAAVIGFGLQNLLNSTVSEANDAHTLLLQNGWVCFLVLLLWRSGSSPGRRST